MAAFRPHRKGGGEEGPVMLLTTPHNLFPKYYLKPAWGRLYSECILQYIKFLSENKTEEIFRFAPYKCVCVIVTVFMQSLLVLGLSECNSKCCGVSSHASSALSCLRPRGSDTPLENLVPDVRGNYGYVPPGLDLLVRPTRFVQTWSSGNSHTTTIRQQSAEIYLEVMSLAWAWEKKWKHRWTEKKRKRTKEEVNKEWTCCEAFCAHNSTCKACDYVNGLKIN